MMGYDLGYMAIIGLTSIVGMIISGRLKSKFNYYTQMRLRKGRSGAEIAHAMLKHYGIHNVEIVEGRGFLSDHYNPQAKRISLSPEVYHGRHVSAAAVAAHECGHAVQHATAYNFLQMRSAIVPIVQLSAMTQQYLLIFAFAALNTMPQIMLIAIAAFGVTALFSFITLPVEFDASKRALAWLEETDTLSTQEYVAAKDALWWAAMTYVAAALSALVMLLYLIMRYRGANNR
jgi:Zn-dependent membrane protease YugP